MLIQHISEKLFTSVFGTHTGVESDPVYKETLFPKVKIEDFLSYLRSDTFDAEAALNNFAPTTELERRFTRFCYLNLKKIKEDQANA